MISYMYIYIYIYSNKPTTTVFFAGRGWQGSAGLLRVYTYTYVYIYIYICITYMCVYIYIYIYTYITDGVRTPDPNPKHLVNRCLQYDLDNIRLQLVVGGSSRGRRFRFRRSPRCCRLHRLLYLYYNVLNYVITTYVFRQVDGM